MSTSVFPVNSEHLLRISHTPDAYQSNFRGYIDTFLPVLESSMDVQFNNGQNMLLKYASGYVSKGKESYHIDSRYSIFLNPATAAIRYAMHLDICEPEMWVLLSSKKFPGQMLQENNLMFQIQSRKSFLIPLYKSIINVLHIANICLF